MTKRRKVGTTSNHHAPYDLGYTRTTMDINRGKQSSDVEQTPKNVLSSDCRLQPACMKSELLLSLIHISVTRQTFREFAQQLPKERFFQCSRGTIVNLEYAKDFNGTAFLLKNGEKLPVSRDLAKDARLAFGDYLFQRRPGL